MIVGLIFLAEWWGCLSTVNYSLNGFMTSRSHWRNQVKLVPVKSKTPAGKLRIKHKYVQWNCSKVIDQIPLCMLFCYYIQQCVCACVTLCCVVVCVLCCAVLRVWVQLYPCPESSCPSVTHLSSLHHLSVFHDCI